MREVRARIRCSGTFHTIGIRDGRAFSVHHDRDDIEAVRTAGVIGGVEPDVPCIQVMNTIDECLREGSQPPGNLPRAILDFLIRTRARRVADLRHRQRHLERRVRRVLRRAEVASREDLGALEGDLEGIEDEIYDRFGGEGTRVLLDAFTEAEARVLNRRYGLDLRDAGA